VRDEIANAAFFYGMMTSLEKEYGDVRKQMSFDDAKSNFVAAARYGLQARMRWLGGKAWAVDELILKHLLPLARQGLKAHNVAPEDIDTYLGTMEERVSGCRTGAQWALDSLAGMGEQGRAVDRYRALTAAMVANQEKGNPVCSWDLAKLEDPAGDRESFRTVGQIMTTDLFTVHAEDIVDLAASMMEWEHLRHVPVEDHEGRLVGLVTHRSLMRILAQGHSRDENPVTVAEVMEREPRTCTPETSTVEAIEIMQKHKIGCLPVVRDGQLVGVVTEHDFFEISAKLLECWLKSE
jgi:CBS domain-containing protein